MVGESRCVVFGGCCGQVGRVLCKKAGGLSPSTTAHTQSTARGILRTEFGIAKCRSQQLVKKLDVVTNRQSSLCGFKAPIIAVKDRHRVRRIQLCKSAPWAGLGRRQQHSNNSGASDESSQRPEHLSPQQVEKDVFGSFKSTTISLDEPVVDVEKTKWTVQAVVSLILPFLALRTICEILGLQVVAELLGQPIVSLDPHIKVSQSRPTREARVCH